MRRGYVRAWVAVLGLAAPVTASALDAGAPAPKVPMPGLSAQSAVSLEALRGRVVYVDFWASWCVPCRLSMPALDGLYRKHSGRGLTVVGVNKDVGVAEAQRFLKRVPVSFPLAADAGDQVAKAFEVKAMPSGYLIDRKGVVRHVHHGFTAETAAALEKQIEALLAEPA